MKRKKNMMGRLAVTAVALTLISTSLMGSTLAKYTTEVSGTGTADVAAWKVAFKEDSTDWETTTTNTFTLADTGPNKGNVAASKIAPNSTGSFVLHIDGTGTEVAFDYVIKIDTTNLKTTNNKTIPIEFYSDDTYTAKITADGIKGTIKPADSSLKKDQTIYWKWVTPTSTGDAADTAVGADAGAGTLDVTMSATQKVQ